MRKLIVIFLLFASISISSNAQENKSVNARVNISTKIISSIELITVNTITFENKVPDQQQIHVNPITDVSAGYMIAVGTPGAEFRLEYLLERTLTRVGGGGSINFVYEISGNTEEEQATSEIIDFENRNLVFNSGGRYFIWVGGKVDLRNAVPGNYEGDFTIEIDYI